MTRETRIAYLETDAAERLDRIGGCVEEIRNRLRDAHAGTGRADELLARVIDLLEEAVDELSSAEPVTPERPDLHSADRSADFVQASCLHVDHW